MHIVGLDLGKRKSQVCIQKEDGSLVAEVRLSTKREELEKALGAFLPARVILESSTSSEWVARVLEKMGCEVVVADPRFSPMYAQANKKIKNDRRDARALADALRLKAYRLAHRRSDFARELHAQLLIRDGFVGSRTRFINLVRNIVQSRGETLASCSPECFVETLCEALHGNDGLLVELSPAVEEIRSLNETIALLDSELEEQSTENPAAKNLRTMRGVGAVTSLAFIAVVDDPKRFASARELSSYLGLVPSERNSGDKKKAPGAITKTGSSLLRSYLVAATYHLTSERAPESNLKHWHAQLAKRSGKKKAAVALARRLARILWAMWRDGKPFNDDKTVVVSESSATASLQTTGSQQRSRSAADLTTIS